MLHDFITSHALFFGEQGFDNRDVFVGVRKQRVIEFRKFIPQGSVRVKKEFVYILYQTP